MARKTLPPHGTRRRYRQHLKLHEPPCGPCAQANADTEYRRRNHGRSIVNRDELEAIIWRHWPTAAVRGSQAARDVAAILDAADAYARGRTRWAVRQARREPAPVVLRHTSGTDLYPLIGTLAAALLGDGIEQEKAA